MPRKKAELAPVPAAEEKETITLSVEVSRSLYAQICAAAKYCGFEDINEWLMESILDKV